MELNNFVHTDKETGTHHTVHAHFPKANLAYTYFVNIIIISLLLAMNFVMASGDSGAC